MERLTPQEETALKAVWDVTEGNIKQILDQVPEPKPPYTTLASTIKNLEKKGFLKSTLIGNTYIYKATMSEDEFKKKFVHGIVRNYFENSYKDMVSFFIEQKKLSQKELKELIALIEKKK